VSNTKCAVCGNSQNNNSYVAKELMFGLGDEFLYFECSECGCVQISEAPVDLKKYYPSDYYSYSKSSLIAKKSLKLLIIQFLKRSRTKYAVLGKSVLGKIIYEFSSDEYAKSLAKIKLTKETRILDVGCGDGRLLFYLKEIGFRNLLGVDPYIEDNICYSNGIEVQKRSLETINGTWDLILFNHSFEHIWDQRSALEVVAKLLSPEGSCLINMPTVSSYAWKRYLTNWVQLDPPRHFFLHSIKSLSLLAQNAGLELKEVSYNSTEFQFWGSDQYCKGIPLYLSHFYTKKSLAPLSSFFQFRSLSKKAHELNKRNQGDQAAFILKKSKLK
jgi:SAM-dependent methyltransferase